MPRLDGLSKFYALMDRLEERHGRKRNLSECSGHMTWPKRGVYFFFEDGELRSDSGNGPRVVRVGTHALKDSFRTSLWNRLSQHKGVAKTGGGNHRGSVFRKIVGAALSQRNPNIAISTWGVGDSAPQEIRSKEHGLETKVSKIIGMMPFLWLAVKDSPSPESLRGYIERNSIALLSNFGKAPLDLPSPNWLGNAYPKDRVRASGLWNSNHVNKSYDPKFIDVLEDLIEQ